MGDSRRAFVRANPIIVKFAVAGPYVLRSGWPDD
jgi:hypothetical protein